jgi:hypothetical protein
MPERAMELTEVREKTELTGVCLGASIACQAGKRLAALGGTQPEIASVPRRRTA